MGKTPDRAAVEAALREHRTIAAAARALGMKRRALSERVNADPELRKAADEAKPPPRLPGGVEHTGNGRAKLTHTAKHLGQIEDLIRHYGLDPDDWIVERARVNGWGKRDADGVFEYGQLRAGLKARSAVEWLWPAVHVPPVEHPPVKRAEGEPIRGVFLSDPHCPYHDRELDALVEEFLREYRPHVGVIGGDVPDFPTLSRHKRNPAYDASPQACVQSGYEWTRGKVEATPGCEWSYIPGNHCIRLRSFMLENASEMYGLRPANAEGDESPATVGELLRYYLQLDALGVEMVEAPNDGQYEKAQKRLAAQLGARHGWVTGANAGKRTAEKLGHSILHGHDHGLAVNYRTRWDMDGPTQLLAAGSGTLADISDGLGYTEVPDWQNGFLTFTSWPDGRFHVEHAVYTAGSLFWRDRRWTAEG